MLAAGSNISAPPDVPPVISSPLQMDHLLMGLSNDRDVSSLRSYWCAISKGVLISILVCEVTSVTSYIRDGSLKCKNCLSDKLT